jgi:hypothetical protein
MAALSPVFAAVFALVTLFVSAESATPDVLIKSTPILTINSTFAHEVGSHGRKLMSFDDVKDILCGLAESVVSTLDSDAAKVVKCLCASTSCSDCQEVQDCTWTKDGEVTVSATVPIIGSLFEESKEFNYCWTGSVTGKVPTEVSLKDIPGAWGIIGNIVDLKLTAADEDSGRYTLSCSLSDERCMEIAGGIILCIVGICLYCACFRSTQAKQQPGQMVMMGSPVGPQMVPMGAHMVPMGAQMVPMGAQMVPIGSTMAPVMPVAGSTVPMTATAAPGASAMLPTTRRETINPIMAAEIARLTVEKAKLEATVTTQAGDGSLV